ncbi:MAG: molybdopterin converting factor subunit 1 [Burkholderiaceae bacterium]
MKLNILFFASLREELGADREQVDLPSTVTTIGQLKDWLGQRGEHWQLALADNRSLGIAVNQALANNETKLTDGAEVAFFPPVTGG